MSTRHCRCSQKFGLHHNPACSLTGIVGEDNFVPLEPVRCIHNSFYPCAMAHTVGCRPAVEEPRQPFGPVQQRWVLQIPFMQQSVLFAAVRAPDGLRKDHPVKVLLRWFRRCILLSAFDRRVLVDPFEPGGGSFTGPFEYHHAIDFLANVAWPSGEWGDESVRWWAIGAMRKVYLRHVDEMPHHFQLHFMHAAQIVGVHHADEATRDWWKTFYLMIVNDAHLQPESDAAMNLRLSDNNAEWRAREEVIAA
jgi:hypothetical protein